MNWLGNARDARRQKALRDDELMAAAKDLQSPDELVRWVAREGRLPVPNFAAGGVATPADAAMLMFLGAESVFVGSGIFKSSDPPNRARAIVAAVTHFEDPKALVDASRQLGEAMPGLDIGKIPADERMQERGW